MSVVAIVLGSLAAYVVIGGWIARRDLPAAIAAARRHWRYDDTVRDSAAWRFALVWALWPVAVPVILAGTAIRAEVERSDPVRLQRRINELERELGVHRRSPL